MDVVKRESNSLYKVSSVVAAFFIWGGWGYFINSGSANHDAASPLISGLVQGTGSSIITLIMLKSVTHLYYWLDPHPLRLILPAILTTFATGSSMALAHTLAGTSNLLGTLAPGVTVAFCFNVATAIALSRTEHRLPQEGGLTAASDGCRSESRCAMVNPEAE